MSVPQRHLLVCTGSDCKKRGAKKVCKAFKAALNEADVKKKQVDLIEVECLGQCGHGPMVVVYPDAVWYARLENENAAEIVDRHLVAGQPVSACLFRRAHGPHK